MYVYVCMHVQYVCIYLYLCINSMYIYMLYECTLCMCVQYVCMDVFKTDTCMCVCKYVCMVLPPFLTPSAVVE